MVRWQFAGLVLLGVFVFFVFLFSAVLGIEVLTSVFGQPPGVYSDWAARNAAMFAGVSALVTCVSLPMLIYTLFVSHKANQIALDGQRAWVKVSGVNLTKELRAPRRHGIKFTFENVGQTPARDVRFSIVPTTLGKLDAECFTKGFEQAYVSSGYGVCVFPLDTTDYGSNLNERDFPILGESSPSNDAFFYFKVRIEYLSNELRCVTYQACRVHRQDILEGAEHELERGYPRHEWSAELLSMWRYVE